MWKIDTWSEGFLEEKKKSKDLPIKQLYNSYCNLQDKKTT